MKTMRTAIATLSLLALTGTALAAAPSENLADRYNAQRDAIEAAVDAGALSAREAQSLYREQRMFRMQYSQFGSDGISADEGMVLEGQLNAIQQMIDAHGEAATVRSMLGPSTQEP